MSATEAGEARHRGQRDVSSPQAVQKIWAEARQVVRAEAPARRRRAVKMVVKKRSMG
jgi:hypothetical protein